MTWNDKIRTVDIIDRSKIASSGHQLCKEVDSAGHI